MFFDHLYKSSLSYFVKTTLQFPVQTWYNCLLSLYITKRKKSSLICAFFKYFILRSLMQRICFAFPCKLKIKSPLKKSVSFLGIYETAFWYCTKTEIARIKCWSAKDKRACKSTKINFEASKINWILYQKEKITSTPSWRIAMDKKTALDNLESARGGKITAAFHLYSRNKRKGGEEARKKKKERKGWLWPVQLFFLVPQIAKHDFQWHQKSSSFF